MSNQGLSIPSYLLVQKYHERQSNKADDEENGSQDEMLLYIDQKEQLQRVSKCYRETKNINEKHLPCFLSSPETLSESS